MQFSFKHFPSSRRVFRGVAVPTLAAVVLGALLQPLPASAAPSADGTVTRVVDGDTIVASVGGVEERVRFLNIDTPEVGTCMADKATGFTSRQLPAGAPIDLRYDRDLRDPYERLLALVKPQGSEWVSVSLAERGLGFPVSIAPNSTYYARVVSAANRAKRTGAGMYSPKRSCTPVSRARRANAMVTQAQGAPVRSKAQYDAANRKLDQALALLALASASRYGVSSTYFGSYTKSLRVPVQRRIRSVRAAKARQWNIVRNQQQNQQNQQNQQDQQNNSDDNHTPSNSNNGWWPPGVPLSYTGPRCYEPGGVIWYPC
ncbi:thermonuclease family protein [Nocardioides sp. T5]|uniref:thermonuclease family protein n=1 Tax=Nocardioides sp. T5 TaxID=3400182 RepID=UPI003A8B227A